MADDGKGRVPELWPWAAAAVSVDPAADFDDLEVTTGHKPRLVQGGGWAAPDLTDAGAALHGRTALA